MTDADPSYIASNDAQRKRLSNFVARLTPSDFEKPVGQHWTVAVGLAHLAFWDRCVIDILDRASRQSFRQPEFFLDGEDGEQVNDAALAGWRLIPPAAIAREVLDAAEEVDARIANLPQQIVEIIRAHGSSAILDRGGHRRVHLNEIEVAVDSP